MLATSHYRAGWALLLIDCVIVSRVLGANATEEQVEFFERKVRPLLVENCQGCHGPDEQNGNLRLDDIRSILAGGDLGSAIIPGEPNSSLIIRAVSYEDSGLQMPPDGKLGDESIATLKQWISSGAPWPESSTAPPAGAAKREFEISDEDRRHWSFQPVQRLETPDMDQRDWVRNPIDAFVLSRLEKSGLSPSAPASKRELIRRASFDLLGLPPTPEEVAEFVADTSEDAYERLIDRLLASPHYGERWARHWLDVVRYAQTDGYQNDKEKPNAWRYRDYVVRALNEDKPYDRFVLEQLAGDELADATHDSIIATGFLRLGPWNNEPLDEPSGLAEEYDEMVRTTAEAFLGMTVGCARCHDHKSDPIPQADYYRMVACFRNVFSYGKRVDHITFTYDPQLSSTPLFTGSQLATWREMRTRLRALEAVDSNSDERKAEIEQLQQSFSKQDVESALSVRETGGEPPPTHILIRGNPATCGPEVSPGALAVLEHTLPGLKCDPAAGEQANEYRQSLADWGIPSTSGRRLALARWIASSANPLTARVAVNRLWQHHFGRGIVATASDFGRLGELPSHPELLDWMAAELVELGWRLKPLHRLIMLSNTYRQSSRIANSVAEKVDSANVLLWRQNMRRLDAEAIRDSILVVNGKLNRTLGGPSFFPQQSPEAMAASQAGIGKGWGESTAEERSRRSLYIFIKRNLAVPMMEALDAPSSEKSEPIRTITTVAPQALTLLNSSFSDEAAGALAHRLQRECGVGIDRQVHRAVELALSRAATPTEIKRLTELYEHHRDVFAAGEDPPDSAEFKALRNVCKLIMNLNEFVYID